MFRPKVIMVALFAMLAFSAVAIGSASAAWFVGGVELKTSAALSTTAAVDEVPTFLAPALGLSIQCSAKTFDGLRPEMSAGSTAKAGALTFLGCNTTKPVTGCALAEVNQSISTNPVKVVASLGPGESVRFLFAPQTGSTFTSIPFGESNTCAFNGLEPIKGEIITNAPTGQLELSSQLLRGLGSVENNSLEIGPGTKVFIDGGALLLRLASGSKWSFK